MRYSETIMYGEILEQQKALDGLKAKFKDDLKKIAAEVKKRNINGIVTAARGSSNNACTYFKYIAEIFTGLPVSTAAPSVYTMYNGTLKLKNSLVIGVSQSGKAADAITVLEKAKLDDSLTVAITNDENSPMAKTADFSLYMDVGKENSVAATKTLTAQFYTLLLLTEALSGDKRLAASIEKIPEGITKTIKNIDQVNALSELLVPLNDCFILARGINYAAAKECGLKIQETTYIKSRAYAVSNFYHGPFAMIDETSVVFLLMPSGESFNGVLEMAEKCESAGAKTIVFTDGDFKGSLYTLKIPSGSDVETPFYNIAATQLLVNSLSVLKGLTPDAPRGLNKITITK